MRLISLPHCSANHVLAVHQRAVAIKNDQFQRFVSASITIMATRFMPFMAFCCCPKEVTQGNEKRRDATESKGSDKGAIRECRCGLHATRCRHCRKPVAPHCMLY